MSNIQIQPLTVDDRKWVAKFITARWGAETLVKHGLTYQPADLPGFIAMQNGERVGLVTYRIAGVGCEIVTLDSTEPASGIDEVLLEAVKQVAQQANCQRLWLMTASDNFPTVHFYEAQGFKVVAMYRPAVEVGPRLKSMPTPVAVADVAVRDEIELELVLDPQANPTS